MFILYCLQLKYFCDALQKRISYWAFHGKHTKCQVSHLQNIFLSLLKTKLKNFFLLRNIWHEIQPHVPPRANCNKGVTTPKRYVASVSFSKNIYSFSKRYLRSIYVSEYNVIIEKFLRSYLLTLQLTLHLEMHKLIHTAKIKRKLAFS